MADFPQRQNMNAYTVWKCEIFEGSLLHNTSLPLLSFKLLKTKRKHSEDREKCTNFLVMTSILVYINYYKINNLLIFSCSVDNRIT